jgi:hypothetical protein
VELRNLPLYHFATSKTSCLARPLLVFLEESFFLLSFTVVIVDCALLG